MATSLASLRKTAPKAHPIVLLYGVEKVGKTALAAQSPSPILIQTPGENPPVEVTIDTFGETPDLTTFMDHVEALFVEEHEFKSLVIDSADGLDRLINAHVCKQNGWQSIEEPGYGKGYVAALDVWAADVMPALMALRDDKGMNVVLIAHAETFRFDSPTSDPYARYRPNLPKKVSDLIQASAEIIAFINHRVSIKKEDIGFNKEVKRGEGAGVRVIYLDERPGFIAGNRYSMPAEIQFKKGAGWDEIAKHLPKAAA
jgi:hypothetical protein